MYNYASSYLYVDTRACDRPDKTASRVHVASSRLLAFALSVPLQTRSDTPEARGLANCM